MTSVLLVSGHEFIGINSFLFICLILTCLLIGGFIRRFNFHYLPESGGFMLFGLICGAILNLTSDSEKDVLAFSPNLIFFAILPPIILDAGYTLKRKDFFQNLGTILLLSIVGTIINNLVFGYLLFGFANLGWIPLDSTNPLECLLFGSLISATDPVATLAMLGSKEVNAHPLLYSLVFGESVLNDAIAIVLYKTFEAALPEVIVDGGDSVVSPGAFTVGDLFLALGKFLGISIGSVCVGVGVALSCCFIFKKVNFSTMPVYEFTLVTLFAYLSYFMAEMMYLSGIMSIFFCSICLAHYNYYNISTNAQIATQEGFKSIAQICETFVFAYIGITAGLSFKTSKLGWSVGMIVLTVVCCLIARACNVFPLCWLANKKRTIQKKIPFLMQIPLWFAGLRGAVAFALSLSFPGTNVKYVVSSTLMLVLFTTIVGGGLTLPILKWTKMTRTAHGPDGEGGDRAELNASNSGNNGHNQHSIGGSNENSLDGDFELLNGNSIGDSSDDTELTDPLDGGHMPHEEVQRTYSGLVGKFKRFDKTVMRRLFGGSQEARGLASGVIDAYGAPVPLPADGSVADGGGSPGAVPYSDPIVDEEIHMSALPVIPSRRSSMIQPPRRTSMITIGTSSHAMADVGGGRTRASTVLVTPNHQHHAASSSPHASNNTPTALYPAPVLNQQTRSRTGTGGSSSSDAPPSASSFDSQTSESSPTVFQPGRDRPPQVVYNAVSPRASPTNAAREKKQTYQPPTFSPPASVQPTPAHASNAPSSSSSALMQPSSSPALLPAQQAASPKDLELADSMANEL